MNAKEYLESKGVFGLDTKKLYNEVIEWMEGYAQEVVKNCSIPAVSGSVFFTTEEVKDLKRVRNYFGEHDKTLFEHWAYSYLDNILKRIHTDR